MHQMLAGLDWTLLLPITVAAVLYVFMPPAPPPRNPFLHPDEDDDA